MRTQSISTSPRVLHLIITLASMMVSSACADLDGIVEGVISEGNFAVYDRAPFTQISGDDAITVVIADEDGALLRTASIKFPEGLGTKSKCSITERGTLDPSVVVSIGDLAPFYREDGVRILNSVNNRFVEAIAGEIEVRHADGGLSGSFHAEMEDGGYLDGRFFAELP